MGQINRETLIGVGAIAAFLFAFALGVVGSMLSLFYPGYFAQYLSLPVVPTLVFLVVVHWLPLALLITTFIKGERFRDGGVCFTFSHRFRPSMSVGMAWSYEGISVTPSCGFHTF
ncbi:hypothetical protein LX70_02461 [Defluviimonas denitrificans]|jgi:hypothetical protein|uniref:Uncharacterized protein n=1 Tax=Albidovulum denitrificans TaxID=404881 RepID=A0A2S8S5X4_9RHOB|nr:hypothetical protein [Defluviimonas denitrificans]PQV56196.1 hypothetical protein LX70_02461 [Defluviimonas denitrificans]